MKNYYGILALVSLLNVGQVLADNRAVLLEHRNLERRFSVSRLALGAVFGAGGGAVPGCVLFIRALRESPGFLGEPRLFSFLLTANGAAGGLVAGALGAQVHRNLRQKGHSGATSFAASALVGSLVQPFASTLASRLMFGEWLALTRSRSAAAIFIGSGLLAGAAGALASYIFLEFATTP